MTRFIMRLVGVAAFISTVIIVLMLFVGQTLPPENEIVFDRSVVSSVESDSNIYRMNIERHIAVALTHDPSKEWLASWSHDGQKIAFVSESAGGSGIYVMDANGQGNHSVVSELTRISSLRWSPDDQSIVYISEDIHPRLKLLDVGTLQVQSLIDSYFAPANPVWSPDGTQIAFVSDLPLDDLKSVYTVNLKNRDVSLLAKVNDFNMSPSWSADSAQIFFVSYTSNSRQFDIYSVDIQSGTLRLMIAGANSPAGSPDGRYLLYQDRDLSSLNLFDLADGKTFLLYKDNLGFLSTPDWSLDGQSIFYVAYRSESSNIYSLNVAECLRRSAGCTPKQLTNTGLSDNPRWRPHIS